jgi:acetyl-CoA C-acetyltransferase
LRERAAVIGVGQTTYSRRHVSVSTGELVREAVVRAIADAQLELDAIGLVVGGVAPDALAGVNHMDMSSIARPGIPYFRVNTGGATGSSAFLAAMTWIAAGRCDAVLVVAAERMGYATTAQAVFNSIFDPIYEKDISVSTISMIAMRATMLMQEYGFTVNHWAALAARNSEVSQLNDTLERPRLFTQQDVLNSPILSWPIRTLEACPMSEGVCAVVLASERLVGSRRAAWIHGTGAFSDSYAMGDRIRRAEGSLVELLTLRKAAQRAYAQAGIANPRATVDCIEIQAPFASSEVMAYSALGLCEAKEGPAFLESSLAGRGRTFVNPSGGPQAANPVSATALIRIAECALQVRELAGKRQRDGVRCAVASGQGGATQFSTAVVLGRDRR